MQSQLHTMNNLFAQLGLPSDDVAIEQFITAHRPLENDIALYRAPFWTIAQRDFSRKKSLKMLTGPRSSTDSTVACVRRNPSGSRREHSPENVPGFG